MVDGERCASCDVVVHTETTPPRNPRVTIDALLCHQKSKAYLLTDISADVLDLITDVPLFDWDQSYSQMADQILKFGLGVEVIDAWQRDLIPGKLDSIAAWWEDPRSSLVNSVVIGLKDTVTRPVKVGESVREDPVQIRVANRDKYNTKTLVTIEIDNWFSTVCPRGHELPTRHGSPVYFDSCPDHECQFHTRPWRPALLIDGQHRVRGIQRPPSLNSVRYRNVSKEPIPVAIVGAFDIETAEPIASNEQAKIFTEISGKATPLDDLHRLFLFFVFKTGVPNEDMSQSPAGAQNPLRSAYETVLRLAGPGIRGNPLENRVKVLIPRQGGQGRTTSLSSDRALREWFEPWFKPGAIWESVTPVDAATEIVELMKAIQMTWTGNAPVSGIPYWESRGARAGSGIFSHSGGSGDMSGFLRLFFDLYPEIRGRVTLPSRVHFQNFLKSTLFTHRSQIGQLAWDGPGWNELRAPDANLNLLRNVLRDVIISGGRVNYDLTHHPERPADLNAYVNLSPTVFEVSTPFGTVPKSGSTVSVTRPVPSEIQIHWRTPLLSRPTVSYEVRNANGSLRVSERTIDVVPGEVSSLKLSRRQKDYSGTGGSRIAVELKAGNHKGPQDPPFQIVLQF